MAEKGKTPMFITIFLLGTAIQLTPHLRHCYPLSNDRVLCTCANTVTSYGPNMSENQPRRLTVNEVSMLEDSAKRLFEGAMKDQWDQVSSEANALKASVCGLEHTFDTRQTFLDSLDTKTAQLMAEITAHDQVATMEAANEITRMLHEPGPRSDSRGSRQFSLLDYYIRELEVGTVQKDVTILRHTVEDTRQTWNEIHSGVTIASRGEAKRFDEILGRLEQVKRLADYPPLVRLARAEADKMQNDGSGKAALSLPHEKRITEQDLPPAVERTVIEKSQGATIRKLSTEVENGERRYRAELSVDGHERDISMDKTGGIIEVEEQISIDAVPAIVRREIDKATAGGTVTRVDSVTRNGVLVGYEATAKRGQRHWEIRLSPDGTEVMPYN